MARGGGEGRKSLPPPGSLAPATGRGAGAGHKARLRARGAWGVERGAAVRLVGAETRCAGRPHFTPGASARQVHRLQKVDADDGRVDAAEDARSTAVKRMVTLRAHGAGLELELQPQVDHL